MAEVLPRDVLLRIGGRTLHRTGVLAALGTARGYVEVKETFARADASLRFDTDKRLYAVSANKVRLDYPPAFSGLVDAQGLPYCGPRIDKGRTNKIATPEGPYTAGLWGLTGATVPSANNPSPRAQDLTASFVREDVSNGVHGLFQSYVLANGANRRGFIVFLQNQGRPIGRARITNPAGTECSVNFNLATGTINSVLADYAQIYALADSWFMIEAYGGPGAGNVNCQFGVVFQNPAGTENYIGDGVSGMRIWGCLATDNEMPCSYPGVIAAPSADTITLPWNGGPTDLTFVARIARPAHADAVGSDLGINPRVMSIGPTAPGTGGNVRLGFLQAPAGSNRLTIDTPTTDQSADQAIPAGTEIRLCGQVRLLTSGGKAKLDVGSGFGAETLAASAIAAFSSQTLYVGADDTAANRLCGVLLDLIFARGQRTLAEMLAIP